MLVQDGDRAVRARLASPCDNGLEVLRECRRPGGRHFLPVRDVRDGHVRLSCEIWLQHMLRSRFPFVFGARSLPRRLAAFGLSVLQRHPRLRGAARWLLRATPGARAIAARLLGPTPSAPPADAIAPEVPRFEPAPVRDDGVVTVEALYHLSRSL